MAPKEKSKPSVLSEEYVVDSSDEQDAAHSDRRDKASLPKVSDKLSKRKSTASSKEHRKRKTPSPSGESSSRSQSSEEDDQAEEDESEEEDEPEVADLLDGSAKQGSPQSSLSQKRPRQKPKARSIPKGPIPAKPFEPPPGFIRRVEVETDSTSNTCQFLDDGLGGKQLWHITAPASVSLESIKTFGVHAAKKGETILKSNGKSYHFAEERGESKCLLVPDDGEAEYMLGKPAFSRTYHLREIIDLPTKGAKGDASQSKPMFFEFQSGDQLPERPKRKQPEGLRMRYKPFGTTDTAPEGSDGEPLEFYAPADIPTLPEEHQKKKSKKPQQHHDFPAVPEDNDAMSTDQSQTLSNSQTVSPQSTQHSQSSPLRHLVLEKTPAGEEKAKKKSKKNKHRVAAP